MNNIFKFNELNDYDLFHLRYGKGAIILAVKKEDIESQKHKWEVSDKDIKENLRQVRKSEKERLQKLKEKLRSIVGDYIRRDRVVSKDEIVIKQEIENLENKISKLNCQERAYFTNFQKAMYYTHNLAAGNEVNTRIDPILKIEELDDHIVVVLNFTDTISDKHFYHSKILSSNEMQNIKTQIVSEINGGVKRIIPKAAVTLEMISGVNFDISIL